MNFKIVPIPEEKQKEEFKHLSNEILDLLKNKDLTYIDAEEVLLTAISILQSKAKKQLFGNF